MNSTHDPIFFYFFSGSLFILSIVVFIYVFISKFIIKKLKGDEK
jgi:hypothetical protein